MTGSITVNTKTVPDGNFYLIKIIAVDQERDAGSDEITARIEDLPPGTYRAEVWSEDETHLFGWAEVTIE